MQGKSYYGNDDIDNKIQQDFMSATSAEREVFMRWLIETHADCLCNGIIEHDHDYDCGRKALRMINKLIREILEDRTLNGNQK